MNKIESVLIIIGQTPHNTSHRDGLLYDLFKTYVSVAKKNNLVTTIIDLSKPSSEIINSQSQTSKVEEFQIKIKNADKIVFFHSILWSLPTYDVVKFIDKVFVPGFAYTTSKGIVYGQFELKELEVIATTESPKWHEMFVSNNAVSYFWNRIFADKCSFNKSKLHLVSNYRSLSDKQISTWHEKLTKSINNINTSNSILDLF